MFSKITKFADKAVGKVKTTIRGGAGNGNLRNNTTVQEMKLFKEHVKELVRMVQECSQAITATSAGINKVLAQQLPRAYVNAPAGGVEPFGLDAPLVGTGVNSDVLTMAATDMQSKISTEVIKPLEQWLSDFSAIKDRNHKCEGLSQELLSQRKTTASAEENAKELQAKNHKNAESAAQKARAEKEKEKRLEEQFFVMEAEIFNDMLVCIKEIQELRKFALMALKDLQACLLQSVSCFDVSVPLVIKLPSPESTTPPTVQDHPPPFQNPGAPFQQNPGAPFQNHPVEQQANSMEQPLPNPFVGAPPAYAYAQPGPASGASAPALPDTPPGGPPAYPGMYGAPPAYPGYGAPPGGDHPPVSYPAPAGGAYPPNPGYAQSSYPPYPAPSKPN